MYIHVVNYDLDIKDKSLRCLDQLKDSNNSTDCTVNLLDRVLMFVVKSSCNSDCFSLIQLMRDLKKQINEESLIYCVVFQVRTFINLISLPTLRIKRILFNDNNPFIIKPGTEEVNSCMYGGWIYKYLSPLMLSVRVTYGRSVVFSGSSGFLHQ